MGRVVNKQKILRVVSSIGFISILFNGCASLGPDYAKPKSIELPKQWESNKSKPDKDITLWWKFFNDKTLDTLVEKTYEQNLDLRSAGLRILQARAALGISEGLRYPQQQALSGSIAGIKSDGDNLRTADLNFDVSWEMDIWGKYARDIESSEATLYASVSSYDEILISIISEVARNYVNYRTAQERIAFAKRNIFIQEKVAKMTEVQFNAGNVSELDMQQAKSQLFITKAVLPGLELSMVKSKNAIAILMGVIPQEIDNLLFDTTINSQEEKIYKDKDLRNNYQISYIPSVKYNENMQIDVNLINRRPDIKVAELNAKMYNAKIGSAQAELYPHFSLFGSIGINSTHSGDGWVSFSDSLGISAGPAFRWNIFQYGRIKNQVRLQDALFQESINEYNKKILQAVQEISNALNGYKLKNEQLEINKQAVDATIRAFNISVTQYNNGLVTYQRLLSTVEKLTRNEDKHAQLKGDISNYVVSLYKALGGGWQLGRNKPYLKEDDIAQMKHRTDWGDYLDKKKTILPKGEY